MSQELTVSPNPPTHLLSVIIPTYNRKDPLLRTLDSLSRQTYPVERFDVIVVDDGGSDGTDQVAQIDYPFRLVSCRQTNQGSAAARNHGAQQSRGDVLVFIDDDMTLHSGYLAEIAGKMLPGTLAMGLRQPYEPPRPSHFSRAVARQVTAQAALATHDQEVLFTDCTSNNLAVHRTDFMRVGMWQDVLGDGPTLWGDVEFGYRAWKKGCRFVRVANARLIHRDHHVTDLATAAKRAFHVSRIVQPLFVLHPEIEEHLPMYRDKDFIKWRRDTPTLTLRKLARQVVSSRPAMSVMEKAVPLLERYAPKSAVLRMLYRWIISGYIYRGYREGLREAFGGSIS